jgi:type IX secretion system PorP/SprF family membrane protein
MNRILIYILISFLPVGLFGQLNYISDLNNLDRLIINPAYAGSRNALNITALYRNQWTGFDNAPSNYSFSAHAPLNADRMGLGLYIGKGSKGVCKETNIMANYAYNIELLHGRLAFGLGLGASIYNIAWNELIASEDGDILLRNEPVTSTIPNVSIGLYYFTPDYFIGFSVPYLLSREMNDVTGDYHVIYDLNKNIFHLTGGYSFSINSQFRLFPSLLLKYQPAGEIQIDFNLQAVLKDKISLGVGYRNPNTLMAMIELQLNPQLKMAYAYDFDLSPLGKYKGGAHEIGISYLFSYQRNVTGPRQF